MSEMSAVFFFKGGKVIRNNVVYHFIDFKLNECGGKTISLYFARSKANRNT